MKLNRLERGNLAELPDREGRIFLTEVAKVYGKIVGFDAEEWINDPDASKWEAKYLDPSGEGHGMSEMDAFRCLVDFSRSLKLMRGIASEVAELRKTNGEIVAIDAGTGTGILAITMALAGCSRVYALEINGRSAVLAEAMVREFGLEDKIQVMRCDATQVIIPETADILASENLSNGLLDEPQYEIITHLSRFMNEEAVIIPSKAILKASLARVDWRGIDRDWEIAKRILNPAELERVEYARVESLWGRKVDMVNGIAKLNWQGESGANALVVSTDFVIDRQGRNVLQADEADFLGASTAYRLSEEVMGGANVVFDYGTGVRSDKVKIMMENGVLRFKT